MHLQKRLTFGVHIKKRGFFCIIFTMDASNVGKKFGRVGYLHGRIFVLQLNKNAKNGKEFYLMSENSRGFCIFYDWFEMFEMLTKEQVADLVIAIGRYYTEGADVTENVPEEIKPLAFIIYKQLERAKSRKEIKNAQVSGRTRTAEVINTTTETKTKTETETETTTETETETETEKNKETKQNTHAHENSREESLAADGEEVDSFGGGGCESKIGEIPFLKSVAALPLPTLGEVEDYVRENELNFVNPRQFYEYNSRRGWTIEGVPIRDWQSVISIWNYKLRAAPTEPNEKPRYGDFDVDEAFALALKRTYGDDYEHEKEKPRCGDFDLG